MTRLDVVGTGLTAPAVQPRPVTSCGFCSFKYASFVKDISDVGRIACQIYLNFKSLKCVVGVNLGLRRCDIYTHDSIDIYSRMRNER